MIRDPHFLVLWFVCFALPLSANATGLFASDEVLDIELRGPLKETIRDTVSREQRTFTLITGGQEITVGVRVRGNSRARECRFPPLRLDFRATDPAGTPFAGQGKLKLITHCSGSSHFENNLLEEYAAYRMFELLTPMGHRVRLLRMRYVDTSPEGEPPVERFAVVLEPLAQLAARNSGEVLRAEYVVKNLLNAEQAAIVFVYQYLIANTDWSLVTADNAEFCCHNMGLVKRAGLHYLVPYDFDLSGLVNAKYAKPDPSLGMRSVKTRRYRGYCIKGLQTAQALERIVGLEDELMSILRNLPNADSKSGRVREKFIAAFFEDARSGRLEARFAKRCIG